MRMNFDFFSYFFPRLSFVILLNCLNCLNPNVLYKTRYDFDGKLVNVTANKGQRSGSENEGMLSFECSNEMHLSKAFSNRLFNQFIDNTVGITSFEILCSRSLILIAKRNSFFLTAFKIFN